MKNRKMGMVLLTGVAMAVSMTSCKKDSTKPDTSLIVTDSVKMAFQPAHFTFYNLKDKKVVPVSDSASLNWDIAFRFYTIILNSGVSGPGNAGAIVKRDGLYDAVTSAPTSGYGQDTSATKLAINSTFGNPNAWYVYEPVSHAFSPVAGSYYLLKTATGNFAKMEITQVIYHIQPGAQMPDSLTYKFRYTYQKNGSTDLSGD